MTRGDTFGNNSLSVTPNILSSVTPRASFCLRGLLFALPITLIPHFSLSLSFCLPEERQRRGVSSFTLKKGGDASLTLGMTRGGRK